MTAGLDVSKPTHSITEGNTRIDGCFQNTKCIIFSRRYCRQLRSLKLTRYSPTSADQQTETQHGKLTPRLALQWGSNRHHLTVRYCHHLTPSGADCLAVLPNYFNSLQMTVGQDNVIKTVFMDTFHLRSTRDAPQSSPNREQMCTFILSFLSAITLCTGFPHKHSLPTPPQAFSANTPTGILCQHPYRHSLSTPTQALSVNIPTRIFCSYPNRHSLLIPLQALYPHRHCLPTPTGILCQHPYRYSLSTPP